MTTRPSVKTLPPSTNRSTYHIPGAFNDSDSTLGVSTTRQSSGSAASTDLSKQDICSVAVTTIPYALFAGAASTFAGVSSGFNDWYNGTAGTREEAKSSSRWSGRSMMSKLRSLSHRPSTIRGTEAPAFGTAASGEWDFSAIRSVSGLARRRHWHLWDRCATQSPVIGLDRARRSSKRRRDVDSDCDR